MSGLLPAFFFENGSDLVNEKEIRFVDLFAGVGGFHKGLEQANQSDRASFKEQGSNEQDLQQGRNFSNNRHKKLWGKHSKNFKCIWACEWDRYAAKVYKKRFSQTPLETKDIRLVKTNSIPKADLLCAGFPCQAFSLAGKRKGFEEARGTLFYEICRIAKAKRVPYLLLENVKGLLSAQEGEAFRIVLDSLDELGYVLQWQVLNSKDFGVPQNRERVFVVGCLGEKRFRQVFPIKESDKGIGKYAQKETSRTITKRFSKGVGNTESRVIDVLINEDGRRFDSVSEVLAEYNKDRIQEFPIVSKHFGTGGGNVPLVLANAVTPDAYLARGERERIDGKAVLTSMHKRRIRRYTPVECERLQGFPDNWTKGLSDTQRYKCMGNAVTVNVVEAVGRRMLEAIFS